MLIRDEQFVLLRQAAARDFERRAIAHLYRFFPQQCAAMGEEAVRASVEEGVARAAVYGVTYERDIVRFLNHMYALGPDFDTDPQYRWAQTVLSDPGLASGPKMQLLSERSRRELAKCQQAAQRDVQS